MNFKDSLYTLTQRHRRRITIRNTLGKFTSTHIDEATRSVWIKKSVFNGVLRCPSRLFDGKVSHPAHSTWQITLTRRLDNGPGGALLSDSNLSISLLRFGTTDIFNIDGTTKLLAVESYNVIFIHVVCY